MKFYEMILFLIVFGGTLLYLDTLVVFGIPVAPIFKAWFGGLLMILVCAMYFRPSQRIIQEPDGTLL